MSLKTGQCDFLAARIPHHRSGKAALHETDPHPSLSRLDFCPVAVIEGDSGAEVAHELAAIERGGVREDGGVGEERGVNFTPVVAVRGIEAASFTKSAATSGRWK